jgi:hypothetical protein
MSRFIALLACIASICNVVNSFSIYGNRHHFVKHHGRQLQQLPERSLSVSRSKMASILSMVTTDRPVTKLPVHTLLVEGKLDNGFSYVILPNSVPAGRFEAHLEVLSGSAHELDQQQGIVMFCNLCIFEKHLLHLFPCQSQQL